jgi:hypothetical protein
MPPQIKQDLNRSGWETTDFPSVCESCLPANPYVQMLKEDHGAECKVRKPFFLCTLDSVLTLFRYVHDPSQYSNGKQTVRHEQNAQISASHVLD